MGASEKLEATFAPRRRRIWFDVRGVPGAQGSKTVYGKGRFVESSAKVKPWRQDVKAAAEAALLATDEWDLGHRGPVAVRIVFTFPRPRSHYGTGRNAGVVKGNAPERPVGHNTGDLDKLCRSTFDALQAAGVIADDCQIYAADVVKRWGTVGGAGLEVWTS
jgi:crossover junction endodeoxyribonuclease RusA